MSAPLDESSTTTGRRSSSAARAASAMVSPSRGDRAPTSAVFPTLTSTIDRGPCTVSRVSIDAWTMPGTLARSRSARPLPRELGSGAEVGEGKEAIAVGATGGAVRGLRPSHWAGAERW